MPRRHRNRRSNKPHRTTPCPLQDGGGRSTPCSLLTASFDWGLVLLEGGKRVVRCARKALAALSVMRVRQIPDANWGTASRVDRVSLLDDEHDRYAMQRWPNRYQDLGPRPELAQSIFIRPGLFAAVQTQLRDAGIVIIDDNGRELAGVHPPLTVATPASPGNRHDAQLVAFLGHGDCGVIRQQNQRQIAGCVVAAAEAFPDARIALLTRDEAGAATMAKEMRRELRRRNLAKAVDHIHSHRSPSHRSRLHVCRVEDGADLPQESVDLLFVADARLLLEVRASELIAAGHHRARIFGFLQESQRLARAEELELARFLGCETFSLLPRGQAHRRVAIVAQRTMTRAARTRGANCTTNVREEIIKASSRNHAIGAIARALTAPRTACAPKRLTPAIGVAKAGLQGRRVLVIVEHIEHALALTALLPSASMKLSSAGWEHLRGIGVTPDYKRVTGFERAICIIATRDSLGARLEHIRADCFDAVLLAGGWNEYPEEFELLARAEPSQSNRPLLCVTFYDDRLHRTEDRAVAELIRQTRWWSPYKLQTRVAVAGLHFNRRARTR